MGVKASIQNLPETLVATPRRETIDINGINIIVILVRVVIWLVTSLLSANPGAKNWTINGIIICNTVIIRNKVIATL